MPRKRLELLQGCPHNDLNVARIPFRHPGISILLYKNFARFVKTNAQILPSLRLILRRTMQQRVNFS